MREKRDGDLDAAPAAAGRDSLMQINDATAEDGPAIAALHKESSSTAYRDIVPSEAPRPTLTTLESEWGDTIADALVSVLIARGDDGIAGVVVVRASPDSDGSGELRRLYVEPGSWRHGIGGLLHDAAVQRPRERAFSRLSLWVLEENSRARHFYEARGWRLLEGQLLEWPTLRITEVRYELEL